MNREHPDGCAAESRIIPSHEAERQRREYRERVSGGLSAARIGAVRPYAADGLLALVIAIAAAVAAAGATPNEPLHTLLILLAFAATSTLAVRRLYPVTVLAIAVAVTGFFAWVYDGYWPFAALVAFYTVAAHSPRGRASGPTYARLAAGACSTPASVRPVAER
jgi:hypothetical protein